MASCWAALSGNTSLIATFLVIIIIIIGVVVGLLFYTYKYVSK